jgi:hypothetical protein
MIKLYSKVDGRRASFMVRESKLTWLTMIQQRHITLRPLKTNCSVELCHLIIGNIIKVISILGRKIIEE